MREYITPETFKVPETVKIDGETYIKIDDLIEMLEDHKDHVKTGRAGDEVYRLAHDHIIELISIYKAQ